MRELLLTLHGDRDRVFHWLGRPILEAARKRLKVYGAPSFSWQGLRRTCGSYLTNSPGIYGSSSAYQSARRLGHSVTVAERHYLGTIKGIPHSATTLEQAMDIEPEAQEVIELVRERFNGK